MKSLTDDRMATPPGTVPAAAPGPDLVAGPAGQNPYVSIILPCHNEEGHVVTEVTRICAAMDASGYDYELTAYDENAADPPTARWPGCRTPRRSSRFHLKIVAFRRNGGSGTVRRIGTQDARGQIVVWTEDADMTYPNERIPELVAMLEHDPDTAQVVGARTSEEGSHNCSALPPAKWFIRKLAEQR